ncbi:hypothetical protein BJY52DRAFT_1115715, partial [Lactarius psammicola]
DRLVKLIQYGAKVLIPILQAQARVQHRTGVRSQPTSSTQRESYDRYGNTCSLSGLWGVLPIIQWLISLERAPPPTRCLTIERTQGWSILVFFPLRQFSFLRTNDFVSAALPLSTPHSPS